MFNFHPFKIIRKIKTNKKNMKSLATGNFTEIASNSYTNTFKVTELFKKQQ